MPVRFAVARTPSRSPVARALASTAHAEAANDEAAPAHDPLLAEALHHFALHGLGAVPAALAEVERAAEAGDEAARRHWLAVCALFDRRAARDMVTRR